MSALRFFGLAAAILLAIPASAGAQVLGTDNAGIPLRQWIVSLPGNTDVTITTQSSLIGGGLTNLPGFSTADSVLSVRPFLSGSAEAGSDGCGTQIRPSCFTFHTGGATGSTMTYVVMLRAYRAANAGQTRVYWRPVGFPGFNEITTLPVTFGGATADVSIPSGTTHVRFDTVLRPGGNTSHQLWLAETNEWRTRRVVLTHNGVVADTARDDFNPSTNVPALAGTYRVIYGGDVTAGAIRVVRNEPWVSDLDGDGLSNALERSLRSCDAITDPNPSSGFSCNARPGCAANADYTYSASLCTNSLRDTDHDGLRDYDELYGIDNPLLWLPAWGSDPAQMDVFVELDQQDQNGVPDDGCTPVTNVNALGGDTTGATPFFDRVNDVYGDAPTSLNPNGASGIRVHWDVGMLAPSLDNTDYGSWGGGGTCVDGAQVMSATRVGYFHSALDFPADGGGDGRIGGSTWAVGTVGGHVHELAHNGGINHSGPWGSAGAADRDNGGYRADYPSRMNYRFSYVGNADGTNAAAWTRMSFSFGNWPALNLLGSPEVCPMGSADLSGDVSVLALGSPADTVTWNSTAYGGIGCWNVDWNQSGGAASGTTYHRATARVQRINRLSAVGFLSRPHRIHSAGDAAVVNDVLLLARPEFESGTTFRVVLRGDGADDDCNEYPILERGGTGFTRTLDDTGANDGSYPGCFRVGSAVYPTTASGARIAADGVAVTNAALPGGSRGVLFVTNLGGALNWSRGTLASASGPSEMSLSLSVVDSSIGGGAANLAGARDPALVQIPGTDETLLVYTTSTGVLNQRSLTPAGTAWTTASVSTAGGSSIFVVASPDLVVFNGEVYMSTASSGGTVRLYRLAASGSPASARTWTLVHTLPGYFTVRRPTLTAMVDADAPGSWRMVLLMAGTDGVMYWGEGPPGSVGASPSEWAASVPYYNDYFGPQVAIEAAAAVWDDRASVAAGLRNLRVFRYPVSPAGTDPAGCIDMGGRDTCPSGSTCSQPYPPSIVRACMNAAGDVYSNVELNPFPVGPIPGVYADYNDWRGLAIGLCRGIRGAAADAECGTWLTWPEPLPGGGMALIAGSAPNDPILYPGLYQPATATCPGL